MTQIKENRGYTILSVLHPRFLQWLGFCSEDFLQILFFLSSIEWSAIQIFALFSENLKNLKDSWGKECIRKKHFYLINRIESA